VGDTTLDDVDSLPFPCDSKLGDIAAREEEAACRDFASQFSIEATSSSTVSLWDKLMLNLALGDFEDLCPNSSFCKSSSRRDLGLCVREVGDWWDIIMAAECLGEDNKSDSLRGGSSSSLPTFLPSRSLDKGWSLGDEGRIRSSCC
jgi:hypothetical protein